MQRFRQGDIAQIGVVADLTGGVGVRSLYIGNDAFSEFCYRDGSFSNGIWFFRQRVGLPVRIVMQT